MLVPLEAHGTCGRHPICACSFGVPGREEGCLRVVVVLYCSSEPCVFRVAWWCAQRNAWVGWLVAAVCSAQLERGMRGRLVLVVLPVTTGCAESSRGPQACVSCALAPNPVWSGRLRVVGTHQCMPCITVAGVSSWLRRTRRLWLAAHVCVRSSALNYRWSWPQRRVDAACVPMRQAASWRCAVARRVVVARRRRLCSAGLCAPVQAVVQDSAWMLLWCVLTGCRGPSARMFDL
jgi:hypothetical protein